MTAAKRPRSKLVRAMRFALWADRRREGLPVNKVIAGVFGCDESTATRWVDSYLEARRPFKERTRDAAR